MTIQFEYHGKRRIVKVEKARATYIQGLNLHHDASVPASTYTISKMSDIQIVDGNDEWVKAMLRK